MSSDTVKAPKEDLVPRRFWILVGGNILSPPPTWDHLISTTRKRKEIERKAKEEKEQYRKVKDAAKAELDAAKKTYKETCQGGFSAWKTRRREAELNNNGGTGEGPGRDDPSTNAEGAPTTD
ncbi:hypothetical protein Cob_v005210 [Colletotrichum orbiculare MAFF 240422]|uniref:Uncharacterized protein n=1 Tax=Colletotrichum orbiculare (strain 104-T / ATCC 96160 / CBS 514.97 / LARS 414 / MAFF 240422) TaxID=1213857 RepID=N4UPK3_COLOR|nr:hypothetical protein Cob_v005210 [Colletotrichum orbiculare MAFF 240422]